ncbi:MAG TPA: preprotein translocase subunit YajC [Planctomycetota bacterium]
MNMMTLQEGAPKPPGEAAPAAPAGPAGTTQQPAPAAPAQPSSGGGLGMFLPLILMFVVFYFLLIRPQKKQQKERDLLIANLKKNDHVVTHAGIYGIVKQISDQDFVLCIDENKDVRIKVLRTAISAVVKQSGGGEGEAKPESPEKAKS